MTVNSCHPYFVSEKSEQNSRHLLCFIKKLKIANRTPLSLRLGDDLGGIMLKMPNLAHCIRLRSDIIVLLHKKIAFDGN